MNDSVRHTIEAGQERLAKDLKTVIRDAEALLRQAVRDAGEGYGEAQEKLKQSVKSAKAQLEDAERALLESAQDAGRATDRYVRRHPWEAIGIGAGIGLVVGLLIGRR